MTSSLHTPQTVPPVSHDVNNPEHGAAVVVDDALLDLTWGPGAWGRAVFWIAVAWEKSARVGWRRGRFLRRSGNFAGSFRGGAG